MTFSARAAALFQTVVSVALVLAASRPSAAQAPTTAPPTPAADYLTFEEVRYSDKIESDGRVERVQHVKVLVRDAAAVAELGQIGMAYVDGYADVRFEDIIIEKPDGKRIEVKNGVVEDINPFGMTGTAAAADVRFKKLTLPGLEPGDRLSYRVVIAQRPLVPGRVFGEVKLAPLPSEPTQVYELDVPRDPGITVELRKDLGASWEDVPGPADRIKRRLTLRPRRPDFGKQGPTEAQTESLLQPDVLFTTFRSWNEVAEWWWALSKDRLTPDTTVRAQALELVQGKTSPRDKLEALHAFVASRVRYLNVSFGLGRMQPRAASDVLAKKYGDCKDKVALLAALASAVGLEVQPVLLHSHRQELRDGAPGPQQFDHMVAVARLTADPKDWLWLDATNELGVAGYLLRPFRDQPALLIESSGGGRIVQTPEKAPFVQRVEVEAKGALQADGVLRMHLRWTSRSDPEASVRDAFRRAPPERRAELAQHILGLKAEETKVTNVSTTPPSDMSQPFRIECDLEHTPSSRSHDKEWELGLPLPTLLLPAPRQGATADEQAVDFGLEEAVVRVEIELPEGFTARAPLSVSLERPFARLVSEYTLAGNHLKLERRLTLLKPVLGSESASYESFREGFDKDRKQEFWIDPRRGKTAGVLPADALHRDGLAAFEKKEFTKAVELFEKAVAADPKMKDGYSDLGRALRESKRPQEAIDAFTRQIEIDPFHEMAYAERAHTLFDLKRGEEAEKDLLKQIEVAPFKEWSYNRLAQVRMKQGKLEDAAKYFERAATLEPKNAATWQKLGWVHSHAGRKAEARAALDRARALNPEPWTALLVAMGLEHAGDLRGASETAEGVVARYAEFAAPEAAGEMDQVDLRLSETLIEAWRVVGTYALASGDLAKAERYLVSAWVTGLRSDAGWQLGLLREKQKRTKEAGVLWAAAANIGGWWKQPEDLDARLAAAGFPRPAAGTLPSRTTPNPGPELTMKLRNVALTVKPSGEFAEEVLVLIGPGGKVEGARGLSSRSSAAVKRVLPHLRGITVPYSWPDEQAGRLVRRGLLSCHPLSTCALVLDHAGSRGLMDR
jgi:tetratricopeptide (TPR) repeat protein/transglutaminase-like putative cysteine protease